MEKTFSTKNLECAGVFESEEEDTKVESDDLKFLTQNEQNFLQLVASQQIASNEILNFSQYFPEVPVSPPNC